MPSISSFFFYILQHVTQEAVLTVPNFFLYPCIFQRCVCLFLFGRIFFWIRSDRNLTSSWIRWNFMFKERFWQQKNYMHLLLFYDGAKFYILGYQVASRPSYIETFNFCSIFQHFIFDKTMIQIFADLHFITWFLNFL